MTSPDDSFAPFHDFEGNLINPSVNGGQDPTIILKGSHFHSVAPMVMLSMSGLACISLIGISLYSIYVRLHYSGKKTFSKLGAISIWAMIA